MANATPSCLGWHTWSEREEPRTGEDRARPGRDHARPVGVPACGPLTQEPACFSPANKRRKVECGLPGQANGWRGTPARHHQLRSGGEPVAEASARATAAPRTTKPMPRRGWNEPIACRSNDPDERCKLFAACDATPTLRRQSLRASASRRPSMWRRTSGLSICSSETQRVASLALGTRDPRAAFVGRSLKK